MRIIRVPAWPRKRDYYLAPEIREIIKIGAGPYERTLRDLAQQI